MPKFMRLMVFFDLPVATAQERKCATQFRNFLINDGYYMLQFSVYARLCGGVDSVDDALRRLKYAAPNTGSIRCMAVTEKQYVRMQLIVGEKKKQEKPIETYQLSFL